MARQLAMKSAIATLPTAKIDIIMSSPTLMIHQSAENVLQNPTISGRSTAADLIKKPAERFLISEAFAKLDMFSRCCVSLKRRRAARLRAIRLKITVALESKAEKPIEWLRCASLCPVLIGLAFARYRARVSR